MTSQTIRDLVDGDWDAVAHLMNRYEPYGMTGEILRTRNERWDASDPRLRLVAECEGRLIGYCRSIRKASEPEGLFRIAVYVDPEHDKCGLGREMLSLVEKYAIDHGATSLITTVEESCPRGIDFSEKAGFEKNQRLFESRLDLPSFDSSAHVAVHKKLENEGFRFCTLETLGDTEENWRALHELDSVTDRDTPGAENWSIGTVDDYADRVRTSYGHTLAGIHIATFEYRFAGMNIVRRSPNKGEWDTDYTGVRREFRGRGLARALKTLGIELAKKDGALRMLTNNDERNSAMLAVNKRLGFVPHPGFFVVKKVLKATG